MRVKAKFCITHNGTLHMPGEVLDVSDDTAVRLEALGALDADFEAEPAVQVARPKKAAAEAPPEESADEGEAPAPKTAKGKGRGKKAAVEAPPEESADEE